MQDDACLSLHRKIGNRRSTPRCGQCTAKLSPCNRTGVFPHCNTRCRLRPGRCCKGSPAEPRKALWSCQRWMRRPHRLHSSNRIESKSRRTSLLSRCNHMCAGTHHSNPKPRSPQTCPGRRNSCRFLTYSGKMLCSDSNLLLMIRGLVHTSGLATRTKTLQHHT